ncbi:unnamed protein product [Peronospora belbahrii]|uniref:Polyprotein n=1 Tax=Peronospora belbahrii TaxID=622444 RepID=A0AAU9KVV7_9STRA|nr:unnamed protein product [Peronospora belbahrii]
MNVKRAEFLLGSGNYFHWEFNMRMTLARKGLLVHVEVVTERHNKAWLVNDAKALGIIAQGVELQHQTKKSSSTHGYWNGHGKEFDAFDELVVGLQTLDEAVDEERQLVVILSSLPAEYELISSIIENIQNVMLIEVKEKLLKECERLERKDTTPERAFKVNTGRFKGNKGNDRKWSGQKKNANGFRGKCFKCNKVGHMKRDCQERTIDGDDDAVFAVSTERVNGWLIDSGATAHMIPHRSVSILHIPGFDRRLFAIAKGKKVGKAYIFKCEQEGARFIQYAEAGSKWELWHARMGHLNQDALIKTRHATNGIPAIDQPTLSLCGGCMKGKQTVATFPHCSSSKTSRVLELVHTDVMGPMTNPSKGGANYVLTFVDDYARYVVTYFLKKKSEVAIKLSEFKTFHEKQWGERTKCLRSDNGTEFVNQEMTKICMLNGIVHQRTVLYSLQQNGVAERMNLNTAVYLINRFTNTQNATVVFKVKPTLDYLCVFNFRGYAQNFKGYRVYDLDAFNIKVCRSVKLDKREVGGIYDTLPPQNEPVTQVTTDVDEAVTLAPLERQPVEAKPMQGVENDALRPREPVFLLEDGTDAEEERKSEGNGGPSSPKRVRIDEDGPIAEAVLAYAASIDDLSTTYAQAIDSKDATQCREAMEAERLSHKRNNT